jgi:gamma-glutamylcyclotransferase (GGCT)/AIG2-like uncharacterized protein YtfP
MEHRCPDAKYVGNCKLHDHVMLFRGVADVVTRPGRSVVCALWEISPSDEAALDRFEGYPYGYTKRYATIQYRGEPRRVMFYIMTGSRVDQYEPPQSYEQTLRDGYRQCGNISQQQITSAIAEAKRSSSRLKTYRGSWVRKDADARRAAEAVQMGPRRPLTPQDQLDLLADDWFARNFDTSGIEGL